MEPFLSEAELEELEQQPLDARIEALADLERTLQSVLEGAATEGDPSSDEQTGDQPGV